MTKTMTAKFPGTCTTCKNRINAGDLIIWTQGKGAAHASADVCKASTPAPVAVKATLDASAIVAFLTGARERGLKFPAVRFMAPGGGELRLSLAGALSQAPGSVQVKIDDQWLGRIEPSGAVVGRVLNARPDVITTINAIAGAPAAHAAEYGKLTGACSFCDRHLEDEGSVEVGYGPVCAKRYGLPHAPKGTPKMQAVAA